MTDEPTPALDLDALIEAAIATEALAFGRPTPREIGMMERMTTRVRDALKAEADEVMAGQIRQAHELMTTKLDEWRQREIDLLVDCINFVMSYGIGDEDGYRARYRELVGRDYGEEGAGE